MESSTEFGKSLLADVRQRKDKQASDARKRAKKDAWKQLGVEVLIGAGKSMIANRQEKFLNNEENLANKMRIKSANDIATQVSQTEAAANAFDGGKGLFFKQKAKASVDDYLQSNYSSGSYNQTDYDMLANNLSTKWGEQLAKQHEDTYQTTQEFLQATGGEGVEAYNKKMKTQRGGTVSSFVAEMIGRGTGMLDKDSANVAANMLTAAKNVTGEVETTNEAGEKVISFKKAYAKTGNVGLSQFIAENNLLENVKLRGAGPKILKTVERTDAFGNTTHALAIVRNDKNGNPVPTYVNFEENGKFSITNPDVAAEASSLGNQISAVVSELRHPIKSRGQLVLNSLSSEKANIFADATQKRIDDGNHSNNSDEAGAIRLSEQNKYQSIAGVLAENLEKNGLFDYGTSNAVASELVLNSIQNPDNNVVMTAGASNPYHTLHALNNVVSEETVRKPSGVINNLVRGNELNFLRSYRNETTEGRNNINTILKDNDNFSFINVQNALSTVHSAVVEVVNNPRAYADLTDSQALKAAFDKLNIKTPKPAEVIKPENNEAPISNEQIEMFKQGSYTVKNKLKGLSNKAIATAYEKEIRDYSNMIENRTATEENIKEFFTQQVPLWWNKSRSKQKRINALSPQEKAVYKKTGQFPDEL